MFKKDLHSKLLCKKCKMNGTKIKQLRKVQECHCRSLNTLASLRGQYTFCKKQQIRRANTEECTPAYGNTHSGVTTSYYWPKQARSALRLVPGAFQSVYATGISQGPECTLNIQNQYYST